MNINELMLTFIRFCNLIFGEVETDDIENSVVVMAKNNNDENCNEMFFIGEDLVGKIFGNWYALEVKVIIRNFGGTSNLNLLQYQKIRVKKLLKDEAFEVVTATLKNCNFIVKSKNTNRIINLKQ